MKKEGLMFFTDTNWTLAALLIFFVVFVVMLYMQTRQYRKEEVQRIQQLPFEGEGVSEGEWS